MTDTGRGTFDISGTPALLLGGASDRVWLFIHGQCGCKEEAERFAALPGMPGAQVLGIDLPEHGGRRDAHRLTPWDAVPELQSVMRYAAARWEHISLRANSIGAWLSLLAFADYRLEKCLFVSPVIDMERMIAGMMEQAGVDEARLRREGEIDAGGGQTLSWKYLTYVRDRPVTRWNSPTAVLYADGDSLVDADTVSTFTRKFGCGLTLAPGCEHWFHTPYQLEILEKWESERL